MNPVLELRRQTWLFALVHREVERRSLLHIRSFETTAYHYAFEDKSKKELCSKVSRLIAEV